MIGPHPTNDLLNMLVMVLCGVALLIVSAFSALARLIFRRGTAGIEAKPNEKSDLEKEIDSILEEK